MIYLKKIYLYTYLDKRATKYWDVVCPKLNACGHNVGRY